MKLNGEDLFASTAARKRQGGCLQGLLNLAVLAAVAAFGWFGLANPWIFTVAGNRYVPLWQGMAKTEDPTGQYRIYIAFYPAGASTAKATTWAKGWGIVCAPGGYSYRVKVLASTSSTIWKDMNGKPFHLELLGSNSFLGLDYGETQPPTITFDGQWSGSSLTTTDDRTIDTSFNFGGTLAEPGKVGGMKRTLNFAETAWVLSDPCS
jgi:hypothetical protein